MVNQLSFDMVKLRHTLPRERGQIGAPGWLPLAERAPTVDSVYFAFEALKRRQKARAITTSALRGA